MNTPSITRGNTRSNTPGNTRVIVGLSGGVDSSVAALLLKQQGYQVEALFMKNWEEDDSGGHCSAEEDLRDARAVCEVLELPLHTVNFSAEYWDRVFEYFLAEYRAGRTPNPDVLCNREIKFRAFLDHALHLGADFIATGHYAGIENSQSAYRLVRGKDSDKDQSYFLYMLGQQQLSHALFPLAGLTKPEVRRLAAEAGLPTQAKKDSTGICFIGERDFREFLQRYLPAQPGAIIDAEGHVIGHHQGLMYYTIGQRKGLGIGGIKGASEEPWFVVDKDMEHNTLRVAQGHTHPLLYHHALLASQLHWVADVPPVLPLRCSAKTRYRQTDHACTVSASVSNDISNNVSDNCSGTLRVDFDEPHWAIAPGQSVVFYDGHICLGGGIIERPLDPPA